jgi:hypothetical protein
MTRKWGSCSTNGIITLAEDLIERGGYFASLKLAGRRTDTLGVEPAELLKLATGSDRRDRSR